MTVKWKPSNFESSYGDSKINSIPAFIFIKVQSNKDKPLTVYKQYKVSLRIEKPLKWVGEYHAKNGLTDLLNLNLFLSFIFADNKNTNLMP